MAGTSPVAHTASRSRASPSSAHLAQGPRAGANRSFDEGVLLTGGPDLDPSCYGAERHPELGPTDPVVDAFEIALCRHAYRRGTPILGICRGAQVLNVARGGTLHQHLPDLTDGSVEHRQMDGGNHATHDVRVAPDSGLAQTTGGGPVKVNSFHHQTIDRLGLDLRAVAWAEDGLIEAVEAAESRFALGVQWHAETLVADAGQLALFERLVEAARPSAQKDRAAQPGSDSGEQEDELARELAPLGLSAAVAGLHPFTSWRDTKISEGDRYRFLYGSMRELARREPTFALHVHVAVPDPERALRAINRLRSHLPLLLALSANSPFWQGRETGLASARTPLFQAFPRVGIPRAFVDYDDYVSTIDLLLRCEAFPEPTFLWWDARLQPRFGTIEVRIMDAQTTVADSAALTALVQCLVRLEATEGSGADPAIDLPEVLAENRFLAARDGAEASLIDARMGRRTPVPEALEAVLDLCAAHAEDLGCAEELQWTRNLAATPRPVRQLDLARGPDKLPGLVEALAALF